MADDKRGREKQARDADRRQQERDLLEAIERADETEPPVEPAVLDEFDRRLESVSFPATGREVVAAVGDHEIDSAEGEHTVADLVPDSDTERFNTARSVRLRVARPTIAGSMKRIVEAADTLPETDLSWSQREAYEKTLRALIAIDEDDEDETVHAITDWIVEQVEERSVLPGSRGVRRQAAKFCRANGFEISNNDWLGV